MSNVSQNQQPQEPVRQQRDPEALLATLIPSDPVERRRAMAALLRAIVDDGSQSVGA